jgi:hypothetical protein
MQLVNQSGFEILPNGGDSPAHPDQISDGRFQIWSRSTEYRVRGVTPRLHTTTPRTTSSRSISPVACPGG